MKIIVVNGGPRKAWNTATLLEKAVEGARSAGAEVETFHLYDLDYKGCTSCLVCKLLNPKQPGRCAMKDGLTPVLGKIEAADALLLGSPIYIGNVTGQMRSFLERFLFPPLTYTPDRHSVFPGKLRSAFIYTMGVPGDMMEKAGYTTLFETYRARLATFGGPSEYLTSSDTFQFDDYTKYLSTAFDPAHKAEVKRVQFPIDLQKAYELGLRLAGR